MEVLAIGQILVPWVQGLGEVLLADRRLHHCPNLRLLQRSR